MNRKLMIKILELLEETYPQCYHVGRLTKKLGVPEDGEFSKVIRYLRATKKIIATERLYLNDEITIIPEGIDFLTEVKSLEINEERTKVMTRATIVLALAAFLQIIFYLVSKGFPVGISYGIIGFFNALFIIIIAGYFIWIATSILIFDLFFPNVSRRSQKLIKSYWGSIINV